MVAGAAGQNLGSAHVHVDLSAEGVRQGIEQAKGYFNEGMNSISGMVSSLGDSLSSLGGSLTTLTAPLLAFGVTGVKTAASFEDSMTRISAQTGIVGEDLQKIGDFAEEMGAKTIYSSQEAADALLVLLFAGQDAETAMKTLPAVMTAAAASGDDLTTTAETLTAIMSSYGLEVDKLPPKTRALADELGITNESLSEFIAQGEDVDNLDPRFQKLAESMGMTIPEFYNFIDRSEDANSVVDSLSRASSASATSMGELGQAFKTAGPVTSMFGISVDQTAAILAIFANNGIKGAEAGTQLKSMLLNMSSTTDTVQGAWKKLGVSMYDAEGNARDIREVMFDLDTALDKLPVEEQNALMKDLGGSYGIVGISALRAGVTIGDMQKKMDDQTSATDVAAKMMDTFNNTVGSLMGSVEALQIAVLTPFIEEVLQPLAAQLIQVVNGVVEWVKANPELVGQITKVLSVVLMLGPALFGAGKAISAIGSILGVITSPLGLAVAAIAGLIYAFETNFMGIRDILTPFINTFVVGFKRVVESIGWFLQDIQDVGLIEAIKKALGFGKGADSWVEGILVSFGMARSTAEGFVMSLYNIFSGLATFVTDTVVPGIQRLVDWFITDGLPLAVEFVESVVVPAIQGFFQLMGDAWSIIGPALENIANWFINDALPAIVAFIQDSAIPAVQTIVQTLSDIWNVVGPALAQLADWFLNTAMPAVMDFITSTIIPGLQELITWLTNIWNAVSPVIVGLVDWFINTGWPIIQNAITGIIIPIIQEFIKVLGDIWTAVAPTIQGLVDWFQTTGWPLIQTVIDIASTGVSAFIEILKGIWTLVQPFIDLLVNWFTSVGWPLIETAINTGKTVIDTLVNALITLWSQVEGPLNSLKDGIAGVFNWIKDNIIQPVITTIDNLIGKIHDALVQIGLIKQESAVNTENYDFGQGAPINQMPGSIPTKDSGGYGAGGVPVMIGQGAQPELFMPSTGGNFYPNADKLFGGGVSMGDIHLNVPVDVLRDTPNIEKNAGLFADTFEKTLKEKMRARG